MAKKKASPRPKPEQISVEETGEKLNFFKLSDKKNKDEDIESMIDLFINILNAKIERYNEGRELEKKTETNSDLTKIENDIIELSYRIMVMRHPSLKDDGTAKEGEILKDTLAEMAEIRKAKLEAKKK